MQPSFKTLLIDADSIPYVIAWNHRDTPISQTPLVQETSHNFLTQLLTDTAVDNYLGFLGTGKQTFRYGIAKHRPYKGKRPDKPDWFLKWESVIKSVLIHECGFIVIDDIEADDAVSICQSNMEDTIIVGKDKDLLQIQGWHYHIDKKTFGFVDEATSYYNIAFQALTGDTIDNICGVPGIGPAKAKVMLSSDDYLTYFNIVREAFVKYYYSEYYGDLIYNETMELVTLLTQKYRMSSGGVMMPWLPDDPEPVPVPFRNPFE